MADAETQARQLGWVPKETFKGDPERWVDAETFVKRGEEIMPLLKANNQRLQGQVDVLAHELTDAKHAIEESKEAMQSLIEHQTETTRQAVKETKARLRVAIRNAREAQDFDAIEELEEQLDDVRETERGLEKAPVAKPAATPPPRQQPQLDPEFTAWQRENPWFGTDKRRTAQAVLEAQLLREDPANKTLVGRTFYDEAARLADEVLSPTARRTTSKVDDSTGEGTQRSSSSGGAKTFASLPADAKAACEKQAKNLVGPNRAFKDIAAWQKHYVEQYYLYND